jgi:copper chaperone CopZ
MSVFSVPEIHCDGCIRSLTQAVRALDPDAMLRADLERKQVEVRAKAADDAVADAMRDAGFDVEVLSS